MPTILATGGTGYVGSHTCVELLVKGYKVILLDSLINSSRNIFDKIIQIISNYNSDYSKNLTFISGDIRDYKLLDDIFRNEKDNKNKIDAVLHYSGLKSVDESFLRPLDYWDVNFCGTTNLLKVMEKYCCTNLVFSSSATIYSSDSSSPIKESAKIEPINPYGNTKAAVEKILDDFYNSKSDKLSIASLRYFNPIGAHSSGLLGEQPNGKPTNIFPLICKVACGEIDELKIFGNDWETHDGTTVRDFVHIMDLAEGHIRMLEYLFDNTPTKIKLNLGTGKGTSVLGLIRKFENVNNVKVPFRFDKRRNGDRGIVYADNSYAKRLLHWVPERSIEEMCIDGWRWQRKNLNSF